MHDVKDAARLKVAVLGAGYVGLVTGTCLAEIGHAVVVRDIDPARIAKLKEGVCPIHEEGLETLIRRNLKASRLSFTLDIAEALAGADIVMIAVGTPPDEDGAADMRYVLSAAREVGRHVSPSAVVVNKSTAPVGTAEQIVEAISIALAERDIVQTIAVVSNPEFLREGVAVADFMKPDRIVVGSDDDAAIRRMQQLYAPLLNSPDQWIVCDARSAELIKYASNAMLATRISFMNEIANLAERVGADIDAVRRGVGSDPRIGPSFLYAGSGFGGSCFPKDLRALARIAQREGEELHVVRAVELANEAQKEVVFRKLRAFFEPRGGLKHRTVAIWGLAFKPNTDDMREAPSLVLIADLLEAGASLRVYDPAAMETARRVLGANEHIRYCANAMEAVEGADALAVVTEWPEFGKADLARVAALLKERCLVDGRNVFAPEAAARAGLAYASIGRKAVEPAALVQPQMKLVSR